MSALPILAPPSGPPVPGERGIESLVPFGIGKKKPHHFREMAQVVWENRDQLGYAFDILRLGVCDGCSLGPRGLRDDVLPGVHLCASRLRLLRNNTIGPFDPSVLRDASRFAGWNDRRLRAMGRLAYPMLRKAGAAGFERISWDAALALAGERLGRTEPGRQAWFATSKGITNEAYYAFTKAARLSGTNNVDFCARLCHAASVSGLSRSIGVGAPTCSLKDLIGTDLLILWGTNLANNQPVAVKYLHHAKEAGTRIVVVNTALEEGLRAYWVPSIPSSALFGSRLMDDFLKVRVGGDIALLSLVQQHLLEWDAIDKAFVEAHTSGFTELARHVRGLSRDELLARCGVPAEQVRWFAELIARSRTMVSVWSMGLTQHRFGTENVESVANLHLLRGAVGRDHCGLLPIRGHSGVQGGGECGVTPDKLPGLKPVDESSARWFEERWGFPIPLAAGLSTGPMLEAAARGEIDFLYNMGGNLLATMPDSPWAARALEGVDLRIHQDIHLNPSMFLGAKEAVLLLPAQTRYEQRGGGTSTSTERRIRFSPEIPGHPVVGESRPEWEIPGLIAAAARPALRSAFDWPDSRPIREEMARVMPIYAGIERLEKAGDWVQWGGAHLCADGRFSAFADGRARLHPVAVPPSEVPDGAFVLTTRRGKQFNSMVFDDDDKVQGGLGRTDLWFGAEDALDLHLVDGAAVRIRNDLGAFDGLVRIGDLARGTVQAYWPEVNGLISARWDPRSLEPDYNAVVWVEPLGLLPVRAS